MLHSAPRHSFSSRLSLYSNMTCLFGAPFFWGSIPILLRNFLRSQQICISLFSNNQIGLLISFRLDSATSHFFLNKKKQGNYGAPLKKMLFYNITVLVRVQNIRDTTQLIPPNSLSQLYQQTPYLLLLLKQH